MSLHRQWFVTAVAMAATHLLFSYSPDACDAQNTRVEKAKSYVGQKDAEREKLIEDTTAEYERRTRLAHDKRMKLEQARRYREAQDVKRSLDMQVKARQLQKQLEKQEAVCGCGRISFVFAG